MVMAVPGRSPVFTFESSVHPCNVLRSLEEQRQRDVLCDVTVVTADDQSFRAHRSVLASCSEYFSQRFSSLTGQNTVITLPPEVTAAGFEPLLKFAYTSKLLFSKEDVLDIQTSLSVLGFKDFDGACFDFLLPKFFSSTKACAPRKTCCKRKCKKGLSTDAVDLDEHLLSDDKEAKPVSADSPSCEEVALACHKSDNDNIQNTVSPSTAIPVTPLASVAHLAAAAPVSKVPTTDNVTQCPKYRKFQIACGKESHKNKPKTVNKYFCNSPCSSNSDSGGCPLVSRQVEDLFDSRWGNFHHTESRRTFQKKQESESQENTGRTCSSKKNTKDKSDGLTGLVLPERTAEAPEVIGSLGQNKVAVNNSTLTGSVKAEEEIVKEKQEDSLPKDAQKCNGKWPFERSSLSPDQSTSGWKCPKLSECDGASQSGLSSLNSGEESDTEETEVYCDAYVQERAKEVQLPYPVAQMLEMSRNDFQELLDKQSLTQEQVEVVRDMRRRSKNREAAQRCRKRKLDCIYNLQCEINKLKTEREKLIQEKSRLSQLRMKTRHTVSSLCQRVCVGANLPPEQLQLLTTYSSAECPLASYFPIIDSLLSSSQQQSTQLPPSGREEDLDRFYSGTTA
ncbi:hypothetical protein WMY93_008236 [Mugilogobius chulae]|uniref:BTB domain-containing protein n=1 Tax=Mugilogobius chulae TaxID=88201 RepID=A0AAW0PGL3_9GOBI